MHCYLVVSSVLCTACSFSWHTHAAIAEDCMTSACDEDDEPLPTRKRKASAVQQGGRPAHLRAVASNFSSCSRPTYSFIQHTNKCTPFGERKDYSAIKTTCTADGSLSSHTSSTFAMAPQRRSTGGVSMKHPLLAAKQKKRMSEIVTRHSGSVHGTSPARNENHNVVPPDCEQGQGRSTSLQRHQYGEKSLLNSESDVQTPTKSTWPATAKSVGPAPKFHDGHSGLLPSSTTGTKPAGSFHVRENSKQACHQSGSAAKLCHMGSSEQGAPLLLGGSKDNHHSAGITGLCSDRAPCSDAVIRDCCTESSEHAAFVQRSSAPIVTATAPHVDGIDAAAAHAPLDLGHTLQCDAANSRSHGIPLQQAMQKHRALFTRSHNAEAHLAAALRAQGAIDIAGKLQNECMTAALVMLADDASLLRLLSGQARKDATGGMETPAQCKSVQGSVSKRLPAALKLVRRVASSIVNAEDAAADQENMEVLPASEILLLRALRARDCYIGRQGGADCPAAELQERYREKTATAGQVSGGVKGLPCGPSSHRVQSRGLPKLGRQGLVQYQREHELRVWKWCFRHLMQHGSGGPRCRDSCGVSGLANVTETVSEKACTAGECRNTSPVCAETSCGCCPTSRKAVPCSRDQLCAPQGSFCGDNSTVAVAQGSCDAELGVQLCAAILSGSTKYGTLVKPVQDCLASVLDPAAVYDIDSNGCLVLLNH